MPKTLEEMERDLDAAEEDGEQVLGDDFEVVIGDGDEDKEALEDREEDDDAPLIQADKDDGDEVEDGEEKFAGKPVDVKRIKREIRLKNAARDEAQASETRAVAAEQLAQQEVAKRLNTEKTLVEVLGRSIEDNIQTKTAALIEAEEAGETKTKVELQGELENLRAQKREVEQAKDRLKTQTEDFERSRTKPATGPTPEAREWLARNRWTGDADFKAIRAAQIEIDRELLASGKFNPNTRAYFDEMDRRLHQTVPTLRAKAVKAGLLTVEQKSRRLPTGGGVGAVGRGAVASSKNRVFLNDEDFKQMRKWGMDPQNKDDRMRWARTKLEQANG